jgi:U2 small nuclear ribonucleoprotein A'
MRLTVELVEGAAQYIHPATRDRELDLRGYKIPVIENMGSTRDQFDSIDFSDNEIRKLENFPLLKRITKLLFNNNRITIIQDKLDQSLPNLSWLILTNNDIKELADIDALACLTKLQCLSLLNNPITTKKHYRLYVINKLPTVRILDFRKVKLREREEAEKLFKGKKGKALVAEIEKQKTSVFVPGEAPISESNGQTAKQAQRTPAEVEAIKAAIAKATTFEEIERLKQQLTSGSFIPGSAPAPAADAGGDAVMTDAAVSEEQPMEQT